MIVIADALPLDVAEKCREAFLTAKYSRQFQRKPGYYNGSGIMPAADENYLCSYNRSHALESEAEFMQAGMKIRDVLSFWGYTEGKAAIYAYKMGPGDYFRLHDDRTHGIGFIYYLSKGWKWDWGGILMIYKNGKMEPVLPQFNQLVLVSEYGAPHFVTPVMEHAKEPRYALVGFVDGPTVPRTQQASAAS